MAEDQTSEAMTAPAGEFQLAIRSAPETSAAINDNQSGRSVFRLMDLPVELQDLVLEYVRVLLLASFLKCVLCMCLIADNSTADLEQRYQGRLPCLQTLPNVFHASLVPPHGS
jgi:hypothetical protein